MALSLANNLAVVCLTGFFFLSFATAAPENIMHILFRVFESLFSRDIAF